MQWREGVLRWQAARASASVRALGDVKLYRFSAMLQGEDFYQATVTPVVGPHPVDMPWGLAFAFADSFAAAQNALGCRTITQTGLVKCKKRFQPTANSKILSFDLLT